MTSVESSSSKVFNSTGYKRSGAFLFVGDILEESTGPILDLVVGVGGTCLSKESPSPTEDGVERNGEKLWNSYEYLSRQRGHS